MKALTLVCLVTYISANSQSPWKRQDAPWRSLIPYRKPAETVTIYDCSDRSRHCESWFLNVVVVLYDVPADSLSYLKWFLHHMMFTERNTCQHVIPFMTFTSVAVNATQDVQLVTRLPCPAFLCPSQLKMVDETKIGIKREELADVQVLREYMYDLDDLHNDLNHIYNVWAKMKTPSFVKHKAQGIWTLVITNVGMNGDMERHRYFVQDVLAFEEDTFGRESVVIIDDTYSQVEQVDNTSWIVLMGSIFIVPNMTSLPLVYQYLLPECLSSSNASSPNRWESEVEHIWKSDYSESVEQPTSHDGYVIAPVLIGVSAVCLIVASILGFVLCRQRIRKRKARATATVTPAKSLTSIANDMKMDRYIDFSRREIEIDLWELPPDRLKISNEELGSGAFSIVYKGKLTGPSPVIAIHRQGLHAAQLTDCDCAVKTLPDYADFYAKVDFIQEINFMKTLGFYKHLVNLIGCTTTNEPLCLISEYCEHGDLLRLLRATSKPLFTNDSHDCFLKQMDLVSFAWQIADAMAYLCSKGCIHRDLAARNVFVNAQKVAKVGDFGLCRLLDRTLYTTRGGRLPIKWMAIESLKHYDWSYGVVLWEIFSLGDSPYNWLQPADMLDYLTQGNRLDRAELITDELYTIMNDCWVQEPEARPTFEEIRSNIGRLLGRTKPGYNYLDPDQHIMLLDDDEVTV